MILLLGATGYTGQAFARELRRRGQCFIPLSRSAFDYTRFELLFDYIRRIRPDIVINAAGYSGRGGGESCETRRVRTFQANTLFPQTLARACSITKTPLGHVSNGCMYSGGKVFLDGAMRAAPDLTLRGLRRLFDGHPELFFGFTELDEPNMTFHHGSGSFLAGTKALAEESLRHEPQAYIWRHATLFNEEDIACNLLSRMQTARHMEDHVASLTHVDDYAGACLELVRLGAPYGIYNVTNSGIVALRDVAGLLRRKLHPADMAEFWENSARARPAGEGDSARILDNGKLLRSGVPIRGASEALNHAVEHWTRRDETSGPPCEGEGRVAAAW